MAHIKKYKLNSVADLVNHYERIAEIERGYKRDNIDNNRTYLNFNLRPHNVKDEVKQAIKIHEDTSKKSIRKDANVFMDWVVTLPQDCDDCDICKFFELVTRFIEDRYGIDNVVGAYVHLDETTPHIHVPVIPLIDGKLVASKMVNRADLRSFHSDLSKLIDDCLGYHVSIELDEQQRADKQLSKLNQIDYVAAKQELEYLRQDIDEVTERIRECERLLERVDREIERKETELDELDEQERELQLQCGQAREQYERVDNRMQLLTEQHAELRLECEQSRKRFEQVTGKFIEVMKSIQSIPVSLFDSFSKLAKQIIQDAGIKFTEERKVNNVEERSEMRSKTEVNKPRKLGLRARGERARAVSNSLESNLTHNSRTSRGYER